MYNVTVSLVIDRLSDFLKQGNTLGLKADIKTLKEGLSTIQADILPVLRTGTKVDFREEGIAILTKRLDGLAYEISSLLEELSTVTVKPACVDQGSLSNKVCSFIPSLSRSCTSPCFREVPLRSDLALKVEVCSSTIRALLDKARNFQSNSAPESFLSVCEGEGEPDEKGLLKHLLAVENCKQVEVISIVGLGGIGKTTLARSLYYDDIVKQHFDYQGWALVSDFFDKTRIATWFLGSSGVRNTGQSDFELLEKYINGKKVLLVFDDVWTEDVSVWEQFKNLLRNSALGSKILVTTRIQSVAVAAGSDFVCSKFGVSNSECWLLISNILAWKGMHEIPREMMKIGKKIAKKCQGSLLTAAAAGMKLLDAHTPQDWQTELDTGEWRRGEEILSLNSLFYMTYNKLSLESKLCFCYCAFFPINHVIDTDQFILLWMAEGYLGYPTTQSEDEAIRVKGNKCFAELEEHWLLISLGTDSIHKDNRTSCKIPRAAHDFIKSLVYHCSADKLWQTFLSFPKSKVPKDLFTRMDCLTALVLSSCHLEYLPSEALHLSQLQYLDLSCNPLKELPEAVHRLSCLQFMDVSFCYLLSHLPQQIGEVTSLKHLRLSFTTDELHILPQGFEKLTLLQSLDVFRVGGKYDSNFKSLNALNQLKDIRIAVHGRVHFPGADLPNKFKMVNLELCFVGEGRDRENAQCIEELEPPRILKMLKIDDYPGLKLPEWIVTDRFLRLRRLSVRSCSNISSFPSLWDMTYLEFLWLYDIPSLKHLGREFFGFPKTGEKRVLKKRFLRQSSSSDDSEHGEYVREIYDGRAAFPRLRTLRIEYLQNWETWEDIDVFEASKRSIKVMPSLQELIIADCSILQVMPLGIFGDTPWFQKKPYGQLRHMKYQPSTSTGNACEIEPEQD